VKNHIKCHQIAIPKGVRDRMSVQDETIINGLIDFAFEQGRDLGYDEGYEDGLEDSND